jgi:uncharacterized OsmC-like protein
VQTHVPEEQKPLAGTFEVTLDLDRDYAFEAGFDVASMGGLHVDETPPIGEASGPSPTRLLAVAVGHCLAASALFCLRKARIEVQDMKVHVKGHTVRNDAGRLRVSGLSVDLQPVVAEEDIPRMQRCLEIFEDFCVVTGAVRDGIAVGVQVTPVSA